MRRQLFAERHRLKASEALWTEDDDASLLDVVRAQLLEESFRQEYHGHVQGVPPLERHLEGLQKWERSLEAIEFIRVLEYIT